MANIGPFAVTAVIDIKCNLSQNLGTGSAPVRRRPLHSTNRSLTIRSRRRQSQ